MSMDQSVSIIILKAPLRYVSPQSVQVQSWMIASYDIESHCDHLQSVTPERL